MPRKRGGRSFGNNPAGNRRGDQWDILMGTEVLNQSDIDALLNAASAPAPVVEAPPTQIFSRSRRDREKIEIETGSGGPRVITPGYGQRRWE